MTMKEAYRNQSVGSPYLGNWLSSRPVNGVLQQSTSPEQNPLHFAMLVVRRVKSVRYVSRSCDGVILCSGVEKEKVWSWDLE
jgi:hypothetical protein